jgi:hypothetical protein
MEGTKQLSQLESVIDYDKSWEKNVNNLSVVFQEIGFNIEKISRVPYLSEGDMGKELYYLDTVIFLLS